MASGEESKLKKVMVAIDESECSHYALEWALDHLRDSLSSPLVVFTAQPYANVGYMAAASYGTPPPELIQSVQEHNKKMSLAILEKAKEICSRRGVITETTTEVGDPKEVICEAVDKLNIDLLILGSNSRGALERFFVGSVSNYCLHNANCPVLVVKK
ncbi:universal stress protein A-like protein [Typha latifolia]|uniref:universal stress protein A-like protein n=1 Tax=Typha latifolia TaxID=4733 RepID=UPI003C2AB6FC